MHSSHSKIWQASFWSSTWAGMPVSHRRIFMVVIAVHFVLSALYIRYQGFNPDEHAYFGYAVNWAKGDPERKEVTDDSKSPIVFPCLLPVIIKPFYQQPDDPYGKFFLKLGRRCMYVYQAAGAFVLFCWLYRLFKRPKFWLPPLLLYLYDPTIFSYGMMVGSDIASAFILMLSCYAGWRYTQTREKKYWYWLTFACCLACIVKASMIFLVPVIMVSLALQSWWLKWYTQRGYYKQALSRWSLLLVSVLLFVNISYYFHGTLQPVKDMPEKSEAFKHLKQQLSFVSNVPVPLPYDYMTGFDMLVHNAEKGGGLKEENSFIGIFILNKYFERGPVWYYYAVSFFYKTPLLIFLLLITSLICFVRNSKRWQLLKDHLFVWAPPLFFFVLMSLRNPFQIGIRHAIIVMPFMYLAASYGLKWWIDKKAKLLIAFSLLHSVSIINYWPNVIAYTNELLFPKRLVYKYFYDSSISYRTERLFLHNYLREHPDYSMPPVVPAPGKYVIDIERLAMPLLDTSYNIHWLNDNFEPYSTYRHSILLFDISEKDLKEKGLK